jgi:SET domain-containing protein 6
MKAILPIQKGDELFNDYGPLPSSDLLRRYGYLTPNYSKYDVVELPKDCVVNAAIFHFPNSGEWITRQVASQDFEIPDGFSIARLESVDKPIEAFEDLLPALAHIVPLDGIPSDSQKKRMLSWTLAGEEAIHERWKRVLITAIQNRGEQYGSTTLEKDLELLKSAREESETDPSVSGWRKILALQVRIGEKEILKSSLEWLKSQPEETSEPSTKRRKV